MTTRCFNHQTAGRCVVGLLAMFAQADHLHGGIRVSSIVRTLTLGVEEPAPVTDPQASCEPSGPFTDGCLGWPGAPLSPQHQTINVFHTDIDVNYRQCAWQFVLSHDYPSPNVAYEPEHAMLYVNQFARVTLSSVPSGFEFIGLTPGEPFWRLPQSTVVNSKSLFLGMAAELMNSSDIARLDTWNPNDPRGANFNFKWLKLNLRDVRGPSGGHFSLWQEGSPPTVWMSTFENGVTDSDAYYQIPGSHDHFAWRFTKPGLYEIDIQASTVIVGTLNDPDDDDDDDDDVDQTDFGGFQICLSGPNEPYMCGCEWADGDVDGDVDMDDFGMFQACTSGPGVPADGACDDEDP